MRKKFILLLLILIFCFPVTAFAEDLESEEDNVLSYEEGNSSDQYNVIVDFPTDPIPVYPLNEDDYNGSSVSTFAINGDVYAGSYNSTVLGIWNGMLPNNLGKDYVAWRGSQYDYYIAFGENFNYNNGTFTGSGSITHYYTYGNSYVFETYDDSFNVSPDGFYLYTNVSEDFPALEVERGLLYAQIQTVILISLLAFSVLRWIFIRK